MNLPLARILFGLIGISAPLLGTTLTVEQRLEALEEEVASLRAENARLRAEPARTPSGLPVTNATAAMPSPRAIKVGGFIQMQADAGDRGDARFSSANDRFYVRRARINTSGSLTDSVAYKVELELAGSLNETSGTRAQATDVWLAYTASPALRFTTGQFKTPFGMEQLSSDLQSITIERSLATDRLTLNRQVGVQVDGKFLERFTYAAGGFNGTGVNTNANDSDALLWVGRATARLAKGEVAHLPFCLVVGGNGYTSHDTAVTGMPAELFLDSVPGGARDCIFAGQRDGLGADLQATLGNFDLRSEYMSIRFRPTNALPRPDFTSEGWYVQGAYLFPASHLQPLLKYESFDTGATAGNNTTRITTAGLNWLIKGQDLKLMTDLMISDVPDLTATQKKLLVRLQAVF